ncbi:hypothetical protein FBU31_000858 [Coemansia sp. 'formosensis']|nr:hypothetical protein FBU31_000858 [Coemansia sp. 'formosensis']
MTTKETTCCIGCEVLVSKVSGLLHISAHGHRHGSAYVLCDMLNFTHHINELSFSPLYPSLVNPLDDTHHLSNHSVAAFHYFISIIPTLYIDPAACRLPTNQYAVNEYYKPKTDPGDSDGKPPGVFFEYSFEPIAITIRGHRPSFVVFLMRVCAAVSGFLIAIGLAHHLAGCVWETVVGKRGVKPYVVGILDSNHPSSADIDSPLTSMTGRK